MDFDLLGSVFFTLALNYKQMELYHALPFFFFLLGRSLWHQKTWFGTLAKLMAIGLTVIGTFALVWLPFLGEDRKLSTLKRLSVKFPS